MRKWVIVALVCLGFVHSTFACPKSQDWLECVPSERFHPLMTLAMPSEYQEQFVPYLLKRGVLCEAERQQILKTDLLHLSQALSLLFEQDQDQILHQMLGPHFALVEGYSPQIDHVGREVMGPLSLYIQLLEEMAPLLSLVPLSHLVFPSTQVVKVLQEHDPCLIGVTIGRVYFQERGSGKVGCIELFQPSPPDEMHPQAIESTYKRFSVLGGTQDPTGMTPIDHISLEMHTVEEVYQVHERIAHLASDTLMAYQETVSHNPSDGSTQTKALLRDHCQAPFNKIIEFVHYQ